MAGHEPTTILTGGPGQPTIVVRDHDGWRAQVEAEKRARVDERIAGTLAWIREGDAERDRAPRPGLSELMADAKVNALLHQERMDAPGRVIRQLAETEALVEAMIATEPPQPTAEQARRERDNKYSSDLGAWMSGAAHCGHGSCMPGACVYQRR